MQILLKCTVVYAWRVKVTVISEKEKFAIKVNIPTIKRFKEVGHLYRLRVVLLESMRNSAKDVLL